MSRYLIKTLLLLSALILLGRVSFDLQLGTNIPISGQSLAVLLIGYYLSCSQIILLFVLYFGAGCLELPVFADGSSGWQHFIGKSGGYLYAFPLAAILIMRMKETLNARVETTGFIKLLLLFLLATAVILVIGMFHLSSHIGLDKAWTYGVLPYIPGGLIKAVAAIAIIKIVSSRSIRYT